MATAPTSAPRRALPRSATLSRAPAPALVAPSSASSFQLVESALSDAAAIMRDELQLALLEVREDARIAVRSFATLGAGVIAALFAASLLLTGAAIGLGRVMPAWAGFVVIGAALLVAATVCIALALVRLARRARESERTIETMDENIRSIGRKLG